MLGLLLGLILGLLLSLLLGFIDGAAVFVGAFVGAKVGELGALPRLTRTFLNKLKFMEPKPVAGSHPGAA